VANTFAASLAARRRMMGSSLVVTLRNTRRVFSTDFSWLRVRTARARGEGQCGGRGGGGARGGGRVPAASCVGGVAQQQLPSRQPLAPATTVVGSAAPGAAPCGWDAWLPLQKERRGDAGTHRTVMRSCALSQYSSSPACTRSVGAPTLRRQGAVADRPSVSQPVSQSVGTQAPGARPAHHHSTARRGQRGCQAATGTQPAAGPPTCRTACPAPGG